MSSCLLILPFRMVTSVLFSFPFSYSVPVLLQPWASIAPRCFNNILSHKAEKNCRIILTLWSRGIKCCDATAQCSLMGVILFTLWLHSNISEQMDLGGSGSYSVLFLRLIPILICFDVTSFFLHVLPSFSWSSGPASSAPEFSVT